MGKQDRGINVGLNSLDQLRDSAIFLSLGDDYLNLAPILNKTGQKIDRNIEKLRGEVASLIKQFPGKFSLENDFEDLLSEIKDTAHLLQQPNKELGEKGRIGELGRDLEEKARALTSAVNDIRLKVTGERPSYSAKDSVFNLFSRFSKAGRPLAVILAWFFKVMLILLGFWALLSVYLFLTMEKEADLKSIITASETEVASKQAIIYNLERERQDLVRRIKEIESKEEILRQDRIAIMDLEVSLHRIDSEIQKAQTEIILNQDRIDKNREKIEEMKQQALGKRLFKPILDFL